MQHSRRDPARTYSIGFRRKGGCPLGVARDMARFDGAQLISHTDDFNCDSGAIRTATFVGGFAPTMARWASFVVGATLISAADAKAWHPDAP
jgi:hypothetical protein